MYGTEQLDVMDYNLYPVQPDNLLPATHNHPQQRSARLPEGHIPANGIPAPVIRPRVAISRASRLPEKTTRQLQDHSRRRAQQKRRMSADAEQTTEGCQNRRQGICLRCRKTKTQVYNDPQTLWQHWELYLIFSSAWVDFLAEIVLRIQRPRFGSTHA